MASSSQNKIYLSCFMFTTDLRPDDREYTKVIVRHIEAMRELGYVGFDLPIAPRDTLDHERELESYVRFRQALDEAGLGDVPFTTNTYATPTFDPSSMYEEQRAIALGYLKSRVDIAKALRADIMAGPLVVPYNAFPVTSFNETIWSDALQDWLSLRYEHAQPVFEELGEYAARLGVKLAIEPVAHWETPGPNLVSDVVRFLDTVASPQVGLCIDSAQVMLGSEGPAATTSCVERALAARRLHYVQISPPDRGALNDSWIAWKPFLEPILVGYDGPLLVEVFNAIAVFPNLLRLTRRKFAIPGEDPVDQNRPNAYDVAREAIATLRHEVAQVSGS
jgi:D-psicose/D-tagatose/L-ribulose 3-epimerase